MTFSFKKLITSLINIIIDSPSSILFIILGLLFSIAMIINIKKNKTMGKTLYLIGWIFIISFVIIKYNTFMSKIFDNLILNVIRQIFFPNIATYTIIIIITNIIFLYTIFDKKSKTTNKLINAPFFIIIMVLMVYTIELVSKNKINIYEAKEVYTNENLRTIIESTTLIFSLWILILISKNLLKILIEKSNKKVLQEYQNKKTTELPAEKQETPLENTNQDNKLNETIPIQIPTIQENQLAETIPTQTPDIQDNQLTEVIPDQTPTIQDNQLTEVIPNQTPDIQDNQLTEVIPNQTSTIQDNQLTEVIPDQTSTTQDNQLTEVIPNQTPTIQDDQLTEVISDQTPTVQDNQLTESTPQESEKIIKPLFVLPKKEEEIEILDI